MSENSNKIDQTGKKTRRRERERFASLVQTYNRSIVLGMIAAAAFTVEGTYLILNAFVLHDPNDPLTEAGRLSPEQKAKAK